MSREAADILLSFYYFQGKTFRPLQNCTSSSSRFLDVGRRFNWKKRCPCCLRSVLLFLVHQDILFLVSVGSLTCLPLFLPSLSPLNLLTLPQCQACTYLLQCSCTIWRWGLFSHYEIFHADIMTYMRGIINHKEMATCLPTTQILIINISLSGNKSHKKHTFLKKST